MMYTRYAVAADLGAGRRVLELGCGAGNGLGLVNARARHLVAADRSALLLKQARQQFRSRVPLVRLDAASLPFRDAAFDVVICFEATYYFADAAAVFNAIARVLIPGGTVLFVNANPERLDFIPSQLSIAYHSAAAFLSVLTAHGFDVVVQGAFPVDPVKAGPIARARAVAATVARRLLVRVGLVPRTLRGRARLKRLIGRQLPLPPELPPH
ncbi:MAG: class I SAM-dependent methyltransferase, partial [Gemmatimonadales bacterium]